MTLDEMREEWTDEAVEAKFRRNVRDLLAPDQIQASLDLMWNLEKVKDVAQIVDQFHI
jgi:hypothetical protein